MRRLVSIVLIILLLGYMLSPSVLAADTEPTITVETKNADVGESVTLDVTLTGNTGFANCSAYIVYDSAALELTAIDCSGGLLSNATINLEKMAISFASATNITVDGKLVTLTFTVLEGATSDNTSIKFVVRKMNTEVQAELIAPNTEIIGRIILPHVHTLDQTVAIAATCEEEGNIEYYTCSGCGKLFSDAEGTNEIEPADTVIAALGHDWDNGVVTTPATCTEDGVRTYTCQNDESHTKTEVIAATGHVWSGWTVTTEATCTTEGEETRVCANDKSHTETRAIAIDADAHDWGEWVVTIPATEDAEGVETRTCKNDPSHTDTRSIPTLDHVHALVKTEAVAATCEEEGNIEYYTCSKCEKLFSDAAGENEIKVADTIVEALGHDWDDGVVTTPATCTEDGVKICTCQNDPSHTKTEVIAATGHVWGGWTVTTEATCTTEGEETRVCANDESHIDSQTIAIDANAHDWGEWVVTIPATEDAEGVETRTCKNDPSHTDTRSIPTLDHIHVLVKTEAVAATCEASGNIEYYTCSGCGQMFSDAAGANEIELADTVIAALGHSWDDGRVTVIAMPNSDGEMTYTCNRCGTTKTESFKIKYGTPTIAYGNVGGQEVETVLSAAILSNEGYNEDNIIYCDITLKISLDNGASYIPATESTMPKEGMTVTIPYPEETTAEDYDYTVAHLLSDGTVETFVPVKSEDGLNVTVKSSGSFAVGYKKSATSASQPAGNTNNPNANNENTPSGNTPGTGDENNITLWCIILFACVTGIVALVNRGKRKSSYQRER